MSIILQSSGGGSVTIAEPTTASNFTQTLPAATGTVAVTDGSGNLSVTGNLSFNSGYGSSAVAYGCRAWVNFNGSNGSINGSGGVSSVTRNGTGDYTVNYSFTFPSNNYSLWGIGRRNASTHRPIVLSMNNSFYEPSTTSARFLTWVEAAASVEDPLQFWFGAIR